MNKSCPHCSAFSRRFGSYKRKVDGVKVQRYQCIQCKKTFSDQSCALTFRWRKLAFNQLIFDLLSEGNSLNGIARILETKYETVVRRLVRYADFGRKFVSQMIRQKSFQVSYCQFDELESFEHTKCKPLTVGIAVEAGSRLILASSVGKIAAKGHLAEISRKKYGPRPCERKRVLNEMAAELQNCCDEKTEFITDQSKHYPRIMREYFPRSKHTAVKGRRGCVVGQGELKAIGFDPIFSLNHTYAMLRDRIKRLTRRTWTTTKVIARLKDCIDVYAWYHNQRILFQKKPSLENH